MARSRRRPKENLYSAYNYARDVIKGRWPEAEELINSDQYFKFIYARDVSGIY